MPIRVFITDDHQTIADGIKMNCVNSDTFEFAGRAKDIEALTPILSQRSDKIDVLLLDTFGTDREFVQEVKTLNRDYPHLPILILTSNDNIHFARRLMDNGARGFLHKMLGIREIFESIKEVYTYPNRQITRLPLANPDASEREEVKKLLTQREIQVIALMCRGFRNNEEIADLLSSINNKVLLPGTVQTHRRNIKKKLRDFGITNDSSLGYWVCKWDLLDGDELSSIVEE